MATFLCQLKNNADFAVRLVTISQFGQGDRIIDALETVVTQFQDGRKVLIAWRADTGELLEHHVIKVTQNSLFKVFREATETVPHGDGTTTTVIRARFGIGTEDQGEAISSPAAGGQPLG